MNVGIIGCQRFTDYLKFAKTITKWLNKLDDVTLILGGRKGTDVLAETFAREARYPIVVYPPCNRHAANVLVINNSDVLIMFLRSGNKKLLTSILRARKLGIRVHVCYV